MAGLPCLDEVFLGIVLEGTGLRSGVATAPIDVDDNLFIPFPLAGALEGRFMSIENQRLLLVYPHKRFSEPSTTSDPGMLPSRHRPPPIEVTI